MVVIVSSDVGPLADARQAVGPAAMAANVVTATDFASTAMGNRQTVGSTDMLATTATTAVAG